MLKRHMEEEREQMQVTREGEKVKKDGERETLRVEMHKREEREIQRELARANERDMIEQERREGENVRKNLEARLEKSIKQIVERETERTAVLLQFADLQQAIEREQEEKKRARQETETEREARSMLEGKECESEKALQLLRANLTRVVCCTACCSASCPLISARRVSLVTPTDCCCIWSCCSLWSLVACTACCSFIRSSCAGCSCHAERKSISSATVSICLLSLWSLFDSSACFSMFLRSSCTVCSRCAAPFASSPVGCCFSCAAHLASRSMSNALNRSLSCVIHEARSATLLLSIISAGAVVGANAVEGDRSWSFSWNCVIHGARSAALLPSVISPGAAADVAAPTIVAAEAAAVSALTIPRPLRPPQKFATPL